MTVTEGVRTGTGGARDMGTDTGTDAGTAHTMAMGTAARELLMKRGEFAIAVHLGLIRLTVRQGGGRPRVDHAEVQRLRSQDGFPEALREKVRTVGTAEGAQLLGIGPDRFTRLARAGCLTPIALYVNRYRVVVWLYLAEELAGFAAGQPELLTGRSPAWVRDRLAEGADHRARNWRSRRVERLLHLAEDPWARAAVVAETLDPVQLAEVVDDPYERAYLARIRPEPAFAPTSSPSARETVAQLMRADEPDEMLWRRVGLIMELDNAREARPAPRPDAGWSPRPSPFPAPRQEHRPETDADFEAGPGFGPETDPDPERGPEPAVEAEPAAVMPDQAPMPDPFRSLGPVPAPDRTPVSDLAAPSDPTAVPGTLPASDTRSMPGPVPVLGPVAVPGPALASGPEPEPGPVAVSGRLSVHGSVPGPDPVSGRATTPAPGAAPVGVVGPASGLLARFRLRRRASGAGRGRRPGPGRAPHGA
ncbi:DUF6397 family protein [Streptomyces sp. NPDC002466]|uniref:DUF6397 family protein n=1 Tax=unclassified Streptomyces TaxID=2593676 RepID=UPI0035DDE5DC